MNNLLDIKYYLKNTFSLIVYKILKIFFKRKKNSKKKDILFINTGQIGDLIVSSLILDNDEVFDDVNVYFLIKQKYLELFQDYKGMVNVIGYNYRKYKWSIFYKIKFIKYLHSLHLSKCYNVTSARGIINDEMSLLSGANEVYCLNSNWRYLKKAFGKIMDKEYHEILFENITNEYDKHIELLEGMSVNKNRDITFINKKVFLTSKPNVNQINEEYITVAPLCSDIKRNWGLDNYRVLCKTLSKEKKIVLLGSENEKDKLELIKNGNKNILNTGGNYGINEIPSIIQKSVLYIGNDSGLTHIALKLEIPMIAIIGGGNYGKFFPFNKESPKIVYLYNEMDCFGCDWKCVYEERYCITKVLLSEVLDWVDGILYKAYHKSS